MRVYDECIYVTPSPTSCTKCMTSKRMFQLQSRYLICGSNWHCSKAEKVAVHGGRCMRDDCVWKRRGMTSFGWRRINPTTTTGDGRFCGSKAHQSARPPTRPSRRSNPITIAVQIRRRPRRWTGRTARAVPPGPDSVPGRAVVDRRPRRATALTAAVLAGATAKVAPAPIVAMVTRISGGDGCVGRAAARRTPGNWAFDVPTDAFGPESTVHRIGPPSVPALELRVRPRKKLQLLFCLVSFIQLFDEGAKEPFNFLKCKYCSLLAFMRRTWVWNMNINSVSRWMVTLFSSVSFVKLGWLKLHDWSLTDRQRNTGR